MAFGTPVVVTYDENKLPVAHGLTRAELRPAASGLFKERVLQAIIDQHPGVLPLREFFPAASMACSLGCEIPVELGAKPGERKGFIDNLLVTDDGHLVLIETKLWRNPEMVREVIAQVMEYAMAIGELGLEPLQAVIRQGDATSCRLGPNESVARRMQAAMGEGATSVIDDFEDAFARYRQTGELLVLIVADGMRTSVERLTRWFGEKFLPGSAVQLGLIELRFYDDNNGGYLVVPVALLRTKELGRHTVVVEMKAGVASSVEVSVLDGGPDRKPTTKRVGAPDTPMTRETLLAAARSVLPDDRFSALETIVTGLERLGLAKRGTPTTWQYGVDDGVSVLSLVMLGDSYIWCQIPSRLRAVLGPDRFVKCKRILNDVAPFYRPEDVDDPGKVNALTPKYDVVVGKEQEFIKAIGTIGEICTVALSEQT